MSEKLKGIIASNGVAIGKLFLFNKEELVIDKLSIQDGEKEDNIKKVDQAIDAYFKDLDFKENNEDNEEVLNIVRAHKELLQDPYFSDTIKEKIQNENKNAELATSETVEQMVMVMSALDDEYLKERADDYKDIGFQVLCKIKNIVPKDLSKLDEEYIVISKELTPSDTSNMDKEKVLAFATDLGGKTSHVSIIAQNLDIPALVGMQDISTRIKGDELAIIDGNQGLLIINPSDQEVNEYKEKIEKEKEERQRLEKVKNLEAKTLDGKVCEVSANIGNLADLEVAIEHGCDGVGLFRTEFLYMENDHFPTEEEQYQVYKKATQMLGEKPLVVRTLDIGGDKGLDYYDFPEEENPFLGYRAIRFCLDHQDIFKAQLRALLRASAFGNLKIMLPFVISTDEIKQTRALLEDLKKDLDKEGIAYNKDIDLGIMVETSASIIMADKLIKYSDFFSIGTNDLTQYTLACDRGNENISDIYNNFNPAVIRSIKHVIDESHKAGKWTGMCGQFASDTKATKLLLGLGLDEFSGSASKLPKVKDIIRNSNFKEEEKFALNILDLEDVKDIEESVEKHN
ncbi:phosphoenolpyruvate--protein phosphotransferase [Anaerococcus hydrogenalis]|uniref:Phosphoenolpyruvate-protein phosphotransferase n=1 Tax=Anaerococcus hydrogenalis TaxID=33029 RepID=A0A2N6UKZ8_9FIRM|nr:phosphoenolpyruvate--protein phosphotransferase [Anaerococcus hydrogenalis]MDK7694481.1 phosphoenolpyruvate--protein phosphotransferase [Anaerococcus hydrogenalis]MDK7696259.1 phosphoenolpyruvate--protein phosphotransferase [Anaerococcus hydrogenalis]MDK7707508.1 phosphoenolpyruvate--protein phosphotransferase [Anaerococcus hydrogenalis]PMC82521.1 phosphoenolpyruvate--protein phosphotransferase [Anaerococcus hydrogenalis]